MYIKPKTILNKTFEKVQAPSPKQTDLFTYLTNYKKGLGLTHWNRSYGEGAYKALKTVGYHGWPTEEKFRF